MGFPLFFKWCELPLIYFALQLRPVLQQVVFAACFGTRYITGGGYGEFETKLIEARTHAFDWNGTTVRLDLMRAGNFIRVAWGRKPGGLFKAGNR
jgi:hypothetical protein